MEFGTCRQDQGYAEQDDAVGLYQWWREWKRVRKHHKWTEDVQSTTRGHQRVARKPPSPAQGSKASQANRYRRRFTHISSRGKGPLPRRPHAARGVWLA